MTEYLFDGEETSLDPNEPETGGGSTTGPTGSVEPMAEEEEEEEIGGGSTTTPGSTTTGQVGGGTMVEEGEENEDEEEPQQQPTTVNNEESILNPEYVKKVKQSEFGELYSRLVSDEQESQCAEFLAPQLIKQDRLYKHTFNAAFGSFY